MSSWLGEIKCRIKLRAKPKYEIFLFSTNSATRIQILNEAVYILHNDNTHRNETNYSLFSYA